jgi:hypothetical protein
LGIVSGELEVERLLCMKRLDLSWLGWDEDQKTTDRG